MNKEQLKAILKETFPEKRIVEKESMLVVVIHEDHLYRQTQDPEGKYLEELADSFFKTHGQRPDVGIRCLYFGFKKEEEQKILTDSLLTLSQNESH